jgi:acyl-CoA reductase-like NAD-dependent aldehyde dehydrogenase
MIRRRPGEDSNSGVGREYGKYGIEAFLEPRAILG